MREYEIALSEYNRLLAHVDKTFKNDIEQINVYKKLINGLISYENKVINIKIKEKVQSILKEYYVGYSKRYGWYELYISKTKTHISFDIALALREEEETKRTRFKIGYLKDRLKKLQEKYEKDILNSKKISEIVGQYNSALQYFRAAAEKLYEIPNWNAFNRF